MPPTTKILKKTILLFFAAIFKALFTPLGTKTNGKIINGTCYIYVNEAKNFNDAIEFFKQIGPARLFEPRYEISSDFFDIINQGYQLLWIGINVNITIKVISILV